MMKRTILTLVLVMTVTLGFAQRYTDKLDRGLVAMKVSKGVYLSWRIFGEEYYDVAYKVYRDGTLITETPLNVSNFTDASGTTSSTYTVAAVVRGTEQAPSKPATVWSSSYKEIKLTHEGIASTLVPNDACCADVDGDGEVEILMKFDNESEISQSFPKNGPTVNGQVTHEYSIFEVLKLDGTRLWWVNCGPNMGDFQNNEQNIVGYDWDGDGKAEVVMRAADGTTIHQANGNTYTVGNANTNVRGATGGGTNWFVTCDCEWLLYLNGETGEVYQCIPYPLKRLESDETDLSKAWGDGYGHRASKHFFGAPYLDGRKPSIFLARGIYTRHKMIAYDVDPATHTLKVRWTWYCNANGPWKGNGYHNYCVADVDWDGRDEIVFGSMVIDDNGKGLSTTGFGHGDAEHVGDLNPYVHGHEIFACMEDDPGTNYRDATTSKVYYRYKAGKDVGRCMAGNFTNNFPGAMGTPTDIGPISLVTSNTVSGITEAGVNQNFRIYWDGDLLEETFNNLSGKNTAGCIAKYGAWDPIYTCAGSLTNNDTKSTPCYQGDILGDWREEIIMRTEDNNIRIYSTPTSTKWRNYTLWHDHQYRNAMVWQMCGYNQPPRPSYFLGELEGITVAPPPFTMTNREEVANGGTINASLNDKHVIVCETQSTQVSIEEGAKPYILTFNVPTWVQGSAPSECTNQNTKITYDSYTCDVTGGGITGEARLVKQGDGILNLPKANFTHTRGTDVWAGTLNFDGTMKNTRTWLNRFAELNSNGGEFRSVKADYGSIIRPGGANSMGNMTIDSLYLGFGSRVVIDLYSTGTAADQIKMQYLNIEKKTGTAWEKYGPEYIEPVIELVGHTADNEDVMAPGKYVIAEVTGDIVGDVANLKVEGLATIKKNLYVEGGKLIVEIIGMRDATTVEWTGAQNNIWDLAENENFAITDGAGTEATIFVSGDEVVFNDNAAGKNVAVKGDIIPKSIIVNNTEGYTFNGEGNISGTAQFVKEGEGTVIMQGNNSYTGGNYLKGGLVKVSQLSNQYTATGNLGGITTSANKFTMENGAVLQTTAAVEQGSPMKMVGEQGGVLINSGDFVMSKALSGTVLEKRGTGSLKCGVANSISKIILAAGHIDCNAGNPAGTVEILNGQIWDNSQATSFAINVPKGKTGTLNMTQTYYTAYNNKVTGQGTLIYNPRNTASRVRITGNWSQFEGTIKHTNTDIWLPLDNSLGIPKGTLQIESQCTVANTKDQTFTIGKLTGAGNLSHAGCDFTSQTAITNTTTTWQAGNNWENGDFTYDGAITDNGSNKCLFNKIGSCKMTVSGAWTNSGAVKVNAGELLLKSGALLGTGALTVAQGATLLGVTKNGKPLTNSSTTINGTLHIGTTATATSGNINFNGKNVTFGANSRLEVGLRKSATATTVNNTYITNIGTLKLTAGATIAAALSEINMANITTNAEVADSFYVWTNVQTINITGNLNLELPELPVYNYWDTSRINEGILYVRCDAAKYQEYVTGIGAIAADETVNVQVFNISSVQVDEFTCPMGSVSSSLAKTALPKGLYLLRIQSETGKKATIKKMK